eukprot:s2065_g6.t1
MPLVPSIDLELSEQEQAVLEKEHQKENLAPRNQKEEKVFLFPVRMVFPDGSAATLEVNPCAKGSSVLTLLLPLKRSHLWPEDFAVFLPSGRLLDFHKPLQAQGVHGGMEMRVDEAGFAEEPASKIADVPSEDDEETDFDNLHFSREVENGWNLIYWPLCVALATFDEAKQAMQKHKEVVVLGWNASHDLEVMQLCQELSFNVGSDYLIVTGSEAPPEEWWPTAQEEADLSAAAEQGVRRLRGSSAPRRPKTSVLRIDPYAAPNDLAPVKQYGPVSAWLKAVGSHKPSHATASHPFEIYEVPRSCGVHWGPSSVCWCCWGPWLHGIEPSCLRLVWQAPPTPDPERCNWPSGREGPACLRRR